MLFGVVFIEKKCKKTKKKHGSEKNLLPHISPMEAL